MADDKQIKFAWLVMLGLTVAISFIASIAGTTTNTAGAALGKATGAVVLAAIPIGVIWLFSLFVTSRRYPAYFWLNALFLFALVLAAIDILAADSLRRWVADGRSNSGATRSMSATLPPDVTHSSKAEPIASSDTSEASVAKDLAKMECLKRARDLWAQVEPAILRSDQASDPGEAAGEAAKAATFAADASELEERCRAMP